MMINPDNLCIYCMKEKASSAAICPVCGKSPADKPWKKHQLPPQTILQGRYYLGTVIGEGGFGITYIGYDLKWQMRVAVKELFISRLVDRIGADVVLKEENRSREGYDYYQECRRKFQKEALALHHLKDKDGVVNILAVFEENQTFYLVMEYLEGIDLRKYLKQQGGRISFGEAYRLLEPAMKSFIEIHAAGIIHRDISPDNIRYLVSGKVKILDFGSAKHLYRQDDTLSMIPVLKEGYAPLEQYRTQYKIGPWMDVYAMSATIYRCITGSTPPDAISRYSNKDILIPPRKAGADVTEKVERVLLKGLAIKAEDRYQDMEDFYKELKEAYIPPTGWPPTPPPPPDPPEHDSYEDLLKELSRMKPDWNMVLGFGVIWIAIAFIILFNYLK